MQASPGAIGIVAPVLAMFANEDQRRRHLRKVFTCEELWCQLFSEPGAGSDLPALRSRAVRDGDSWILNGHKVWTTMGHIAQFGLLLARTSDRPRHKGITCFILDMSSPGVEVRPLRQMTGEAEFNEVFFTDVVIPDCHRIGEVDDGWRIAIGTLMEERNAVNYVQDAEVPAVEHAIALWHSLPADARTPVRRDRLADLVVQTTVYTHMSRPGALPGDPCCPWPRAVIRVRSASFVLELGQLGFELRVDCSDREAERARDVAGRDDRARRANDRRNRDEDALNVFQRDPGIDCRAGVEQVRHRRGAGRGEGRDASEHEFAWLE